MRIHDGPSRHRHRHRHRRGAVMVEAAIVLPALFSFLMGTIIIGMGMFYYQQVAALAREGARYASVHGSQYASETGNAAADWTEIRNNAVLPMATGLNAAHLSVLPNWPPSGSKAPANKVQVTVSYDWTPGMYIGGTITLSSTSEMVINY